MSGAASLLFRLDRAVRQAVAAGEVGTARSIRLHVGAPVTQQPDIEAMLALGDAIFACGRLRMEMLDGNGCRSALCVWEHGQIGTITAAVCEPPLMVLTVLGQRGALHFQQLGA